MPSNDITKCANGCEMQSTCWRWLAPAKELHSYSDFKPDEKGNCEHYWKIKKENKIETETT